jgi:hypothetical protein
MSTAENDSLTNVRVRVSEDRLALLVSCKLPEEGLGPVLEQLASAAEERKIALPKPAQLAARLVELAAPDGTVLDAALVEGTPPTPPQHGRLEWTDDFFSTGFVVDERTGALDYRRRKARTSVKEGEALVRVIAPSPGKAGIDVFGQAIPAEEPWTPHISAGKGVRYDAATFTYFAEQAGRIRWASEVVAVDDLFHIEGSVGLETGNVYHPGAIVVEEDILPGSEVRSEGDIEVHGMIEGAIVESGGNITVAGGIAGGEGCTVRAAGGVHARFILDASIDAGEDVMVEKEIIHSTIRTRGAVIVDEGRIVGGRIQALGGVVAGRIGTEGFVPTTIVVGEDYRLQEKVLPLEQRARQHEKNMAQIETTLNVLAPRRSTLPASKKASLRQLEEQGRKIRTALKSLRDEIEEIRRESTERAQHRIVVKRTLWPETIVAIHGDTTKVSETFPGPVVVKYAQDEIGYFALTRQEADTIAGKRR